MHRQRLISHEEAVAARRAAALEAFPREDVERPIEELLAEMAKPGPAPIRPFGLCLVRIDEAGPHICRVLERAADGEELDEADSSLLFRGLHLVGGTRYAPAFGAVLRLLALPDRDLDPYLGDVITETLPRIVAGVFDGDTEALFAAAIDPRRDEYVRDALIGAATFLTYVGAIRRFAFEAFLKRTLDERPWPKDDHAWVGLQAAVSLLGMRRLKADVEKLFSEQIIGGEVMSIRDFRSDLIAAERQPRDVNRFLRANLGYIEDTLSELLRWPSEREEDKDEVGLVDTDLDDAGWERQEPVRNPLRHVGRNDPCTCGSGKKAKKCCLAA